MKAPLGTGTVEEMMENTNWKHCNNLINKLSSCGSLYRINTETDEIDEDSRVRRLPVVDDLLFVNGQIDVGPREIAKQLDDLIVRGQLSG